MNRGAWTRGCLVSMGVLLLWLPACRDWGRAVDANSEASATGRLVGRAFAESEGTTIADVAERSVAGVVNVFSEKLVRNPVGEPWGPFFDDPFFRHFFGGEFPELELPRERRERSLGSGVLVDRKGIILTNSHVVENAERVRVASANGREYDAEIVGVDPQSDLAVLRMVDAGDDLQALEFGDSNRLRLGDLVLAVGNPFGIGQTVTLGIVSAKGRANVGLVDYEDFIQTDAAINPGNSGGALVNMKGELVGINTAILTRSGGYQGIGFAIPSNMAKSVMRSLLDEGRVIRGWLGVAIQDVTEDLAEALGLGEAEGVLVAEVVENSPAERAGLKRGDVIVRFDDVPVHHTGRLRNRVALAGAGAKVQLEVIRGGESRSVEAELVELPQDRVTRDAPGESGARATLEGLEISPLNDATRQLFAVPRDLRSGVVVMRVAPDSGAARAGLRPGDVIREVNGVPVASVAEFRRQLKKVEKPALLLVQRMGSVLFVPLRRGGG